MNKLILLLVLACPLTAVAQNWTGSNACVDSDGYSFVNFSGAGSRIDTLSAPVRLDGHSARIQTFIIVQQEWQTLRLAGKIRTEIPVGRAEIQLDLRSDMNSYEGRIYSEDLHFSNNEWRPFEIEIALSDEVNYCMTTVFVNGEGTAWVADLHLTADNKPIQSPDSFKPYTPIYPADSQTFSGTSGFIAAAKSGRQQLENLKAACRAWGEIKYLHPAVARGEFNMDNKLFELLPLIYNASSKEQKRILNAWKAEFGTYNPSAALPVYHYYFGTAFRMVLRYSAMNTTMPIWSTPMQV